MDRTNLSHGKGGQESGLNAIGTPVSGGNATDILSSVSNQSLPFSSSATPLDS